MDGDNVSRRSAPRRRRYAGWAQGAIVTTQVALLLEGRVPAVNVSAAVFALIGLRQIRRSPERYMGRAFCWIAIALVLILAILTAMVEPLPAAGVEDMSLPGRAAGS